MNVHLRLGAAIVAVSLLSGCATVVRGTKVKYQIVSEPAGADVELTTGVKCKTPCDLKLKRNKPFIARFKKEGYQPLEATVDTKFNGGGALAGNLILGGLIGGGVDAASGALQTLRPNPLNVTLVAVAAAPVAAGPEIAAAPAPVAESAPAAEAAPAPAPEPAATTSEAPPPQLL